MMKKRDLKSGMIIETRSGERALIVKDNCYGKDAVIFHEKNWTELDSFNHDLLFHGDDPDRYCYAKSIDIVKIFKPNLPTGFLSRKSNRCPEMELLWERKELAIPEYTMEEIIAKVGFEFKIKK
jgi:hypothetical protein